MSESAQSVIYSDVLKLMLNIFPFQLDFRTKLCIRDSLYRLAQGAEQRHNLANLNAGGGEEGDEETNRYIISLFPDSYSVLY